MSSIVPVVLSGGSGTRLWPLSRLAHPKQFIHLDPKEPSSLLATTLSRLGKDETFGAPLILCSNRHRFRARAEADVAGVTPQAIVLEPVSRNTAPAVTVAALMALRHDPDAILVVMPSDHILADPFEFRRSVATAVSIAKDGHLVLFGITPDRPHTGYGYIKCGDRVDQQSQAHHVAAFTEKPDRANAERFLKSGNYCWNSGIFILHAQTLIDEMSILAPEVFESARDALDAGNEDLGFFRLGQSAMENCPNISLDHAVMEQTAKAIMVSLNAGWTDVGSWTALWDISDRDDKDNATHGDVMLKDAHACYVHASHRYIAGLGIDNLIVVETPDALLVADKSRSQDVSLIVEQLKDSGRSEYEHHVRHDRPWGYFETLNLGSRFQVKLLHVNPGARLSLQRHHHRSEHWIVVRGTAKVTIGDQDKFVPENESVYITATQWHRLENPGKVPMELIEVQIGSYLGEDDIIRADDDYQRAPDETR